MGSIQISGVTERALGMGEVAALIQSITGRKPSRSTIWRWHLSGRLVSRRIGGRLYATEQAVRHMLAADELRNAGSSKARGDAAKSRITQLLNAAPADNQAA